MVVEPDSSAPVALLHQILSLETVVGSVNQALVGVCGQPMGREVLCLVLVLIRAALTATAMPDWT